MLFAKYVNPNAGYDFDKQTVRKYLTIDFYYKVKEISMGGSHTNIYLEDFPDVIFNSVNFDFFEGEDLVPIDIYEDPRYNPYL